MEVTVVGARGLQATRTARVELVLSGGRLVRTRPAAQGLKSGPSQLIRFGDWFVLPAGEEASPSLVVTIIGTRIGGKEGYLGQGDVFLPPLFSVTVEEAVCPLP